MTIYDDKYMDLADNILEYGYFDNNRTGVPTYKLPHQIMQFNLKKEFPILTTKFVAFNVSVKELLWIFKDQSNSVEKLKEQNVKIWNEWEQEDGTIGTAYGWVIKKFNQMDELIEALKNNPQDRRMMINLWQIPYLKTGALAPCCFCTMWDVTDGRLNCMLIQRSGDCGLGVPFNTTQYAVLVHLLAQVTGLKPGLLTHVINNAHIYENHVEPLKQQIKNYEKLKTIKNDLALHGDNLKEFYASKFSPEEMKDFDKYLKVVKTKPTLWINPNIKDFYDFTPDDIKIEGYNSLETIKMVVAV